MPTRSIQPVLALILGVAIAVSSCTRDRIHGKVQDPFGHGIDDVSVTVLKSAFSAITSSSGEYSLDYAPGVFTLRFAKAGFTTMSLDLTINQKSDFPAQTIVLYPIPSENGIYYLSTDHLEVLPKTAVYHSQNLQPMASINSYSAGTDQGPTVLAEMHAVFLDTDPQNQALVKLGPDRLIYAVTYHLMFPQAQYEGWLTDKAEQIGEEKLWVRTAPPLLPGTYAWVDIGQGPVIGSAGPGEVCFPFIVSDPSLDRVATSFLRALAEGDLMAAFANVHSMSASEEARAGFGQYSAAMRKNGEIKTLRVLRQEKTSVRQLENGVEVTLLVQYSTGSEEQVRILLLKEGKDWWVVPNMRKEKDSWVGYPVME